MPVSCDEQRQERPSPALPSGERPYRSSPSRRSLRTLGRGRMAPTATPPPDRETFQTTRPAQMPGTHRHARENSNPNLLICSQNQGVRPTLVIRRNPLCHLGSRLSWVRVVCGRFASSRGPNADQTRLPGFESRFVEATHPVLMTNIYSQLCSLMRQVPDARPVTGVGPSRFGDVSRLQRLLLRWR